MQIACMQVFQEGVHQDITKTKTIKNREKEEVMREFTYEHHKVKALANSVAFITEDAERIKNRYVRVLGGDDLVSTLKRRKVSDGSALLESV